MRIPFFGYFCVEQSDGSERILINRVGSTGEWTFPIWGEFDSSLDTPDRSISSAVSKFIDEQGFVSRDEFQTSGFSPFEIHFVHLTGSQPTAYFFKVRLLEEFEKSDSSFSWVNKSTHFAEVSNICLQSQFLEAIEQNRIYEQAGFVILECIDILVFKKQGDDIQFLMLRREDRSLSVSGWEYSKGPVYYHETHRESAARELLDETGLNIVNYKFIMNLGYQTVNVHWRKKNYDTMHLLGMTYLLIGNEDDIVPYKKEGLRRSTWMSWERAKEAVWMRDYGPKFFHRWRANEELIRKLI